MKSRTENRLHPVPPYDVSVIAEGAGNGTGFYAACKDEQMRKVKPARYSLNELAKVLKLLSLPEICDSSEEGDCAVLRLEKILANATAVMPDRDQEKSVLQFRRRVYSLIDSSAGTGAEPSEAVISDNGSMIPGAALEPQGDTSAPMELDDGQKHLLYNMLIANGCSPAEAKTEIESFGGMNLKEEKL